MKHVRLSIIGFGVVGQGLAELLHSRRALLLQEFELAVTVVSVANARDGFIYREEGLDIPTLLELAARRQPLTGHTGVRHWASALEGLRATGGRDKSRPYEARMDEARAYEAQTYDVLVEATGTNLRDAEPGMSHIRAALAQGMHVVTANKGPGALAGAELLALARTYGVQLRMESSVMAGTPVLSTIREGMAGTRALAMRGILNGTTNYILSAMAAGRDYAPVLAEAQTQGYAEADPTADVEGYDAVAKTLILAALVFGRTLKPDEVVRRGITAITREQVQQALAEGKRMKLIASLRLVSEAGSLEARVEPMELPLSDPLARVDGVMNAITIETDTLHEVTVIGPGAGRLETGQGLLADVIAIANSIS